MYVCACMSYTLCVRDTACFWACISVPYCVKCNPWDSVCIYTHSRHVCVCTSHTSHTQTYWEFLERHPVQHICIFIYIYIYIYTHTHTHIHQHISINMCEYTHIYVHASSLIYMHHEFKVRNVAWKDIMLSILIHRNAHIRIVCCLQCSSIPFRRTTGVCFV